MHIVDDMKALVAALGQKYTAPPLKSIVFPLVLAGNTSRDCEFMALLLDDGSAGISYVSIPDEHIDRYLQLDPRKYRQRAVQELALGFGSKDPVEDMIGMAAINAICQHVMRTDKLPLNETEDSLGKLNLCQGDTLGMVGFFRPVLHQVQQLGAGLIVLEKNSNLVLQYPELPMTMDPERLKECNKILITSTTVLNKTIDSILPFCGAAELIAVIGPTAGFLPDPLFSRGVDIVGGRYVHDGEALLDSISRRRPWGSATSKLLFEKRQYVSPLKN